MQRIQDPTAVATQPAVPTLTGTTGFFTNGNPGTVPSTVVPDWYLNMTQEELIALLVSAGLAVDGSASVTKAVQVIGARSAPFLASGNFTVPAGVFILKRVRVWAAGGSGGTGTGAYPGGGGGGGGYVEYIGIGVTPGQIIPVVVGLGAVASAGGNSSFGPLTANGGQPGGNGSSSVVGTAGTGGNASGGNETNFTGGSGSTGINLGGSNVLGGIGGTNGLGGSPAYASGSASIGFDANPGAFPGGGSSGCTGASKPGGNGYVVVEY